MRRARVVGGTATWLAAFVATALVAFVATVDRVDEAWMLWVMERVARGDALYRDVYDVTTPFPAWLGGLALRLTTSELLVLRGLLAAVVATEVLTGCAIARRAGMRRPGRLVLGLVLVACASPMVVFLSLYTAAAVLGALLALRALVWLIDRHDAGAGARRPLVSAALAVALSFWSKPNIGFLALVAVLATLAALYAGEWRTIVRASAVTLGVVAAVSAVASLVLVATGAWSAFVDQVFASKGEYLDVGFSYVTAIERRMTALSAADPVDARAILWLLVLATPVVSVAAVVWAWWNARWRPEPRVVAFTSFVFVAILGVVPRPGVNHLAATLPIMMTAAACAVLAVPERLPTRSARRGFLVTGSAVAVALVAIVAGTAVDTAASGAETVVDLRHFAGTPVSVGVARRAAGLRAGLRAHGVDTVFFVREDAGFLHLVTGTSNPLPYDIAERSDLGADGEHGVIRRLEHGDAEWVCLVPARLRHTGDDPLVPRTLERWVRDHAELTAELPMCDLYRVTAPR